jgi:hypothetical protein
LATEVLPKKIQNIFARGIDSCLATRVFAQFQGGIPLQEILQLLHAGRYLDIRKQNLYNNLEYTEV